MQAVGNKGWDYFMNLKENGYIERVGSNKAGYWKVLD